MNIISRAADRLISRALGPDLAMPPVICEMCGWQLDLTSPNTMILIDSVLLGTDVYESSSVLIARHEECPALNPRPRRRLRLTTRGVVVLGAVWLAATLALIVAILHARPELAGLMRSVVGS